MPVSKPAKLPEWASAPAGGDLVEPLLAKKQAGWIVEAPAHEFLNWWMNLVFLWAAYLDDLANQAWTWAGAHIFNSTAAFNGATVNFSHSTTVNGFGDTLKIVPQPVTVSPGNTGWNISGDATHFCRYWLDGTGDVCFELGGAITSAGYNVSPFTFNPGYRSGGIVHFWGAHNAAGAAILAGGATAVLFAMDTDGVLKVVSGSLTNGDTIWCSGSFRQAN